MQVSVGNMINDEVLTEAIRADNNKINIIQ